MYFAVNEFKDKEKGNYHSQRAESWDVYRSNQSTILAMRKFLQSVPWNLDEDPNARALMWSYRTIESDITEMYTEFEMCLRAERCNEEILVELACRDAISVARSLYQNHGKVLFSSYSDENVFTMQMNIFHFTSRCKIKPFGRDFIWLDAYQNLAF